MTEEEAKTKSCPIYSQMLIVGTAITGIKPRAELVQCNGSTCMMWRWDTKYIPSPTASHMQGETVVSATDGCSRQAPLHGAHTEG